MAFKMKNPSMAKLTKAAGDNRVAMKMKMEEKAAAAKMKRESAMKMEKESMAKLMEKSAMKMKSPMKADIPEVTVTADKEPKGYYTMNGKRVDIVENDGVKFIKDPATNKSMSLDNAKKQGGLKFVREGGSATKMKKSPIKADIPEVEITDKKDNVQRKSESNNAKRKAVRDEYNRLKKEGTDQSLRKARAMEVENKHGFFTKREGGSAAKMKKSATKFNAELKAASKAGKLSGKFKEAVDASPAKRVRIDPRVAKIEKDLRGGREMLAAKKNPGKPKRVGTSIYEDTYQGTGDTRSTRKAERKFAKAEKKLAKGKFKQAERKVKKGRKTVVSMPSGSTKRERMK